MNSIYAELVGIPGSGKTALLAALKNESTRTPNLIQTSSATSTLSAYQKYVWGGTRAPDHSTSRKSRLRVASPLGWSDYCQARFPEIFSLVFESLQMIPNDRVNREQVLNFWRVRLSEFAGISKSQGASTVVTDEGLAQAMFGTLMRLEAPSSRKRDLVQRFVFSLPPQRIVIFVNTPLDLAIARNTSGKSLASPFATERGENCVSEILAYTCQVVDHVFEVDGSLNTAENARIVLSKLASFKKQDRHSG